MSDIPQTQPPGWYYAQGDPPGTHRWWDGTQWVGGPQPVPGAPQAGGFPTAVGGGVMAEPLNRIGARFIDFILWFIVSLVLNLIFLGGAAIGTGSRNGAGYIVYVISQFIVLGLIAGYEVFLVGTRGATLGKMALGLRVVSNNGQRLSFLNATGRYFAKILSAIILCIGFLMIAFTDRKRGKVLRIEEPVYGGANGALKIAHDMPAEYWEKLK